MHAITAKQGKCVFCPRPGRLTKQHVWPRWLMKKNQPHVTSHTQISAGSRYDEPDFIHRSSKRRQGHSGTRTARKVCRACNNGWIERLEEKIRDPLTKIMAGETIVLNTKLRRDFAAWFTLVTMMAEFMDPATMAIPRTDHQFMYENGRPPREWKMWIARYAGNRPDLWPMRQIGLQLLDSPDVLIETPKCDTKVATFVLGQLCVHTFRSTVLGNRVGTDYVITDMPRIWPLTRANIHWPCTKVLSDRGVLYLSECIIRMIGPAPAAS